VLPVLVAPALDIMFLSLGCIAFFFLFPWCSLALPFQVAGHDNGLDLFRRVQGLDVPIHISTDGVHRRGGISGSVGLGDNVDLLVNLPDF
jgi:hypothetical protein